MKYPAILLATALATACSTAPGESNAANSAAADSSVPASADDTPVSSDQGGNSAMPANDETPASGGAPPAGGGAGAGDCPVTASSGWAAWVNAMPGPDRRPTLIVTGKVTVPTGGYTFEWTDMRVAESMPVQVTVTLKPVPPSGPATQAVMSRDVRGSWPSETKVGSVTVRCGSKVLAQIAPVETAY